ncbi:MAG: T9SS type A sorting domain-containing protein [Bacteroidetes bacterium]|nr:T9SS type A sorting domain-containing protein [Bacteroidota bacterium]
MRTQICSLPAAIFMLLLSLTGMLSAQQDPMVVHAEDSYRPVTDKPRARAEYFYHRVTYPGGDIPPGGRVRAWRQAQEKMSLFAPTGTGGIMDVPEWRNVGPVNVGGRILAVAANPRNPETVFIGAADGGIWRSWDAGRSWHSVSDELPTQAMGAIAINPVDTSIIYAGTGEASWAQRTFDGGGMFKSTNSGTTWTEIGATTLPPYSRASDMVINPLDPDIIYAAIPDGMRDDALRGIWRSTDAGENWTLILTGQMTDIVLNPQEPDILYTASSKIFEGGIADRYGMLKSTDGGDTWMKLDIGVPDSLMGRTSIGICDAQPDVLYIGVSEITGDDRTHLLGVFKTEDGGATWTELTVPFDYMVSQGWYDNIMGVHPVDPDIAYAGGVKLIVTRDGGSTWERVPDQGYGGIVHVDQHAIDFRRDDPSVVYLGNDGGFFVGTNDGTDWEKRDYGLSITQFIGGAMHPSSDAILFGGTQDNGTLFSNRSPEFELVLYGDGGNGAINPEKPNIMYTTRETLKFYRSDDFGETWTRMQNGMGMDRSLFYIDYAMDPNDPDVLYLGTSRMYKTTNGGENWILKSTCPVPTLGGCYYVSALSVAPYDSRFVFAGGAGGGISISRDAGETWEPVADSLRPIGYCSAVRSFRPGVVYATYSRYGIDKVWRSLDTGATWTSINGNLPDVPLNDIVELDGNLIVGSDVGAFVSVDDGTTWQRFGTGMPSVSVQRFVYSTRTGTLRAITHGRGMYDMQWAPLSPTAPEFVSRPDTTMLEPDQPFIYAPVVDAVPAARFHLLEAPVGATVDSVLGVVRWTGGAKVGRFVLEARNDQGSTTQVFHIPTNDVRLTDWAIVQPRPLSTPVNGMAWGAPNALWLVRDSALVSRSIDGGLSWEHRTLPGTNAQVLDIHAFDSDHAIVGTRSGEIMKTSNGGGSWSILLSTVNSRFGNIHFHDSETGIAVTEDTDRTGTALVYRTVDGGRSWEILARVPARFPIDRTLTFIDREHGWFASSNLSKSPPAEPVILRTQDGGRTWEEAVVSAQNIHRIAFFNQDRGLCVDDMTGNVRRSVDGGRSWRSAFFPMSGKRNVAVQTFPNSASVWIVGDDGAWVSPDAGASWTHTKMVDLGSLQDAVFADSATGWVVTPAGMVQKLVANPLLSVEDRRPAAAAGMWIDGVYPNPAPATVGTVRISFRLDRRRPVRLEVYNSAGVRIAQLVDANLPAGTHETELSAGNFVSGAYFVALHSGTDTVIRRMILAR